MNRWIPHPVLSVVLVLMWLILTQFSLGQLVLGTAIALVAGWAMGALQPSRPGLRRPDLIVRLVCTVGWDILRANGAVAWLLLTGDRFGARRSGFIRVTLQLKDPAALAVLAIILTATPGTAWLDYDIATGTLLLHVFDLRDNADLGGLIRTRYEAPLLEIFR